MNKEEMLDGFRTYSTVIAHMRKLKRQMVAIADRLRVLEELRKEAVVARREYFRFRNSEYKRKRKEAV